MNLHLEGKVALVTGSTSGIGEAIARAFVAEGAKVVICGREPSRGEAVIQSLNAEQEVAIFIPGDLSEPTLCQETVAQTSAQFGRLDILVNNAGANDKQGLTAGPDAFMGSIKRNLLHYYALAHYALPHLRATTGNIINIGSKVAVTGQGETSGYAASKGAIQALTREWAVELRHDGIRVNEVVPAEVWTQLYEKWIDTFPNPEEKRRSIELLIPLGHRFTTSEEIADTVVFLASSRASHITGQHIYVDGGYTHFDRSLSARYDEA